MAKIVFVTVGSTQFDNLIREVLTERVLETLHSKGYHQLTIQIGKGAVLPERSELQQVKISYFRYKDNLYDDFHKADLVISHAGAGSCIEALEAKKPLIAVVNDSLMNNHQEELAEALADLGYCHWCYTNTLYNTLKEFDSSALTPYTPGKPEKIVEYLDSVFEST